MDKISNYSRLFKWFYNPFQFIAGWKAFGIGMVILILTTIIGHWGHVVFYALEIKTGTGATFGQALILQLLGLSVTVTILYLTALCFARHTRFQDILGTITLAKYPLLPFAFVAVILRDKIASINATKIIEHQLSPSGYIYLSVFAIISLLILIWEITLLYNAFSVSSNLKKTKCAILFTIALIVSEIVTLLLVSAIY